MRSSPLRDPGAFAPVRYKDFYLPTAPSPPIRPIRVAVAKGAPASDHFADRPRLCNACATDRRGGKCAACADAADRPAIGERAEGLDPGIEILRVPPLCPLVGSPYDSRTSDHIARAIQSTDSWLAQNGLEQGGIPARCVRIALSI